MKRKVKRILASLLAVVLFLTAAPLADLVGLEYGLKAEAASYKTGDIITFGMYPQNYVEDSYLRARLAEQEYDSKGVLYYEGQEYIKIGTAFYYYEPITWRVLSVDSDGLYVMAEKILDCQPYHQSYTSITWADCSLRTWLNTEFYNMAFSSSEKQKINLTHLVNGDNPWHGTYGGIDTYDRVFVPSVADVLESAKGFSSDVSDYDSARRAKVTKFAERRGVYVSTSASYYGNGYWWLRTPGRHSGSACFVYYSGYVSGSGFSVNGSDYGVRPALKLNLQSLQENQVITGTFESYVTTVVIDSEHWVSKIRIDGTDYDVQKGLIKTIPEAESYKNKFVTAYLDENGEVYSIEVDVEKKVNEENWYQSESGTDTNYGVKSSKATKASQVLEATNDFVNAMQSYLDMLGDEVDEDAEIVNVDDIVKELKNKNHAYFSLTNAPEAAEESVYYAVANFIKDVANDNKIYLKLNTDDTEEQQAVSMLKSLMSCFFRTTKVYYHGNYKVTLKDIYLAGQAFFGTITVEKYKGSDKGTKYTGALVSSTERTKEVLVAYVNNLSDIVQDECKYALAQIQSDFMNVTGLAELSESALNEYFTDKSAALLKGKYGDVLKMFINIKRSYDAIDGFKNFCKSYDADDWLSYNNMQNTLNLKSELDKLNVDYSLKGTEKWCVKSAIKTVEDAKKKLSDALYNYIYGVDTGDPENMSGWDKFWSGNWNCSTVQCPVEFEVYDSQGNILGYVDSSENHSEYIDYTDDIIIDVVNDVKYIYYPSDMEISIKFTAIDDGQMNYSIEQFTDGVPTGKINYFDIPLTLDEQFEQTIPASADLTETVETLNFETSDTVVNGEYISAEEEAYVTVNCQSDIQGFAIGGGEYPLGSSVKMMAFADEGCEFQGWYIGESLVSTAVVYQFTATEDVEIVALFDEIHDVHTFVDGMCTVCGDVTDTPSSIQNVTYVQQEDTHKTFAVTCNGRAQMIQFIEPDGGTRTYDRYNKNVSITSYDADGNEVSALSRDLSYEVWEIYTNLSVGTTVMLRAKFDSVWETDKRTLFVEEYNPVISMELSATSGKKGAVPATVVADEKTEKVMFKMPNNTSVTVSNFTTDENGNRVFTGNAWMNEDGTNEIKVYIRRDNVWKLAGTLEYTVE
ncbi:MAG: hypothetical protein IJ447_01820 [Clostridia bacterium]|nr:hypothetical protein [Clostridia bacterium]